MARAKQHTALIRGQAAHRRTEGDYMGVLLEAVTLDDWREVVNNTKAMAKSGDPQARAWLAQYLMGKPAGNAPSPMTVVVQQLNGADPLVEKLAAPVIHRLKYPELEGKGALGDNIRALIAAELAEKVKPPETIENLATARLCGPSAAE